MGDTVQYEIQSPISIDVEYLMSLGVFAYQNIFSVYFPGYEYTAESDNITNEQLMEFAKCCYCVNQVIPVDYSGMYVLLAPSYDEEILTGDVNFDKTVNTADVTWLAKSVAGLIKFTDAQNYIADLNNDGEVNMIDTGILVETIIQADKYQSIN